jgi:hypothetical protein
MVNIAQHRWIAAAAGLVTLALAVPVQAVCRAASGAGTGVLVELFTSEGCSSCPPAERWLTHLPAAEITSGRLVPIALHVAYWDYLGWKDPFAHAVSLDRQNEYKRLAASRYVYTPQVVLGGRDFRGWTSPRFLDDMRRAASTPSRATVALVLNHRDARGIAAEVIATIPAPADRPNAQLHVALVQNGLVSRVRAGENRGATLEHAHVARDWAAPIPFDAQGRARLERVFARPVASSGAGATEFGLVAFVQDRSSGAILQALALPACD